jgi:hypothetical protein
MATWADIQRGIFAGESGGDYGALFNYQNRPDGQFSNVDLTQMTIDDALQFADPSGPYAQYVKGQVGRVATPMGAYQVVGTTLRAAKQGLGLTGNERMTPELQDRIGQWVYETQGTGAWEGYKGPRVKTREGSVMDDNTMNAQNAQAQAAAAQAAAQEQSGSDKFREVAGNLAIAFNSMRLNPDPNIASTIRDIRDARSEKQAKNKTLAYLEKIGRSDLVSAIEAGLSPKAAISQMFTEAAELRGFERQKELATPKQYQYQSLANDLLAKGIAKDEKEALEMALSQTKAGTTVNVGGGSDKQIFETMKDSYDTARRASTALSSLKEAQSAIKGAITGPLAEQRLQAAKLATFTGFTDFKQAIQDTETFKTQIAPQVGFLLKQTTGSTQVSDTDRKFAQDAAAGNITFDQNSISRVLNIMERLAEDAVNVHNEKLNKVYPEGSGFERERAMFGVAPLDVQEKSYTWQTVPIGGVTTDANGRKFQYLGGARQGYMSSWKEVQ